MLPRASGTGGKRFDRREAWGCSQIGAPCVPLKHELLLQRRRRNRLLSSVLGQAHRRSSNKLALSLPCKLIGPRCGRSASRRRVAIPGKLAPSSRPPSHPLPSHPRRQPPPSSFARLYYPRNPSPRPWHRQRHRIRGRLLPPTQSRRGPAVGLSLSLPASRFTSGALGGPRYKIRHSAGEQGIARLGRYSPAKLFAHK